MRKCRLMRKNLSQP